MKLVFARSTIDPALLATLAMRAWQAGAGLVTLLLIAQFFSAETQGFYYTISSLLALQVFVELGLYVVIVTLVSHEWSKLHIDSVGGVGGDADAQSRLSGIVHFVIKWYSCASILFVAAVGLAGYQFLAQSISSQVQWHAPWVTAVALAGLQIVLLPLLSILEGCNRVAPLARFRLAQAVMESLAIWAIVAAGGGLWAVPGLLLVKNVATIGFIVFSYRQFFLSILRALGPSRLVWKDAVWPMQWRLAAQGAVNYFMSSLFVPVMFHFHGSQAAGRMGMTLQILSVVQLMAMAWMQTKAPTFGMLIAQREFTKLDSMWTRASQLSLIFGATASGGLWIVLYILHQIESSATDRILDPISAFLLLVGAFGMLIVNLFATYLRAFGREPFLVAGVLGGLLMGTLVYWFGSTSGPIGAAAAYAGVAIFFSLPYGTYIWTQKKKEWQL